MIQYLPLDSGMTASGKYRSASQLLALKGFEPKLSTGVIAISLLALIFFKQSA